MKTEKESGEMLSEECKQLNDIKPEGYDENFNGMDFKDMQTIVKTEPELDIGVDFLGVETSAGDNNEDMAKKCTKSTTGDSRTPKLFQCHFCDYKSFNKGHFIKHVFRHSSMKPHCCPLCEYRCGEGDDLKTHIYKLHTVEETSDDGSFVEIERHDERKLFQCHFCDYTSYNRSNFTRHVFRHTGLRPYRCSLCQYRAAEGSDLRRHMNLHTDQKPYECSICKFGTVRSDQLARHMLSHVGEIDGNRLHETLKKYTCDLCNYRASSLSDVKKHRYRHGLEKPYECTFCPYKSSASSDLKKHLLIHAELKPYSCDQCMYKARRAGHLKSHKKIHSEPMYHCNKCTTYRTKSQPRYKLHVEQCKSKNHMVLR